MYVIACVLQKTSLKCKIWGGGPFTLDLILATIEYAALGDATQDARKVNRSVFITKQHVMTM